MRTWQRRRHVYPLRTEAPPRQDLASVQGDIRGPWFVDNGVETAAEVDRGFGASGPQSRYRLRSRCRGRRLMPHWAAAAGTGSCAETTLEDGNPIRRHAADCHGCPDAPVTDQVSPMSGTQTQDSPPLLSDFGTRVRPRARYHTATLGGSRGGCRPNLRVTSE